MTEKQSDTSQAMTGYFLDDERFPDKVTWISYPDNITWKYVIRTARDFFEELKQLDTYENVILSFDHDLGMEVCGRIEARTGYHAMMWFCHHLGSIDYKGPLPTVIAHSMNPIGAKKILDYWDFYKTQVYQAT